MRKLIIAIRRWLDMPVGYTISSEMYSQLWNQKYERADLTPVSGILQFAGKPLFIDATIVDSDNYALVLPLYAYPIVALTKTAKRI